MKRDAHPMHGLDAGGRSRIRHVLLPGMALLVACVLLLAGREALERGTGDYAVRLAAAEADRHEAEARRLAAAPERHTEVALLQIGREVGLINRDWSGLLAALVPETADVRLLAVEVDPAAGTVRVSGSGDRAASANDYAARLEARDELHDVRLVSLERSEGQLVFEAVARWRE